MPDPCDPAYCGPLASLSYKENTEGSQHQLRQQQQPCEVCSLCWQLISNCTCEHRVLLQWPKPIKPIFRKKRSLEHELENLFDDYHSKYSLVTFQPQVPYAVAKDLGNKQDALLMDLCEKVEKVSTGETEGNDGGNSC